MKEREEAPDKLADGSSVSDDTAKQCAVSHRESLDSCVDASKCHWRLASGRLCGRAAQEVSISAWSRRKWSAQEEVACRMDEESRAARALGFGCRRIALAASGLVRRRAIGPRVNGRLAPNTCVATLHPTLASFPDTL